jgi:hypothetical protein
MSCRGLVVLVNQAAETVSPPDGGGDRDSTRVGLVVDNPRRAQREASMRPLTVVVPQVLVEDPLKMASTPDQQPVQAFLPVTDLLELADLVERLRSGAARA